MNLSNCRNYRFIFLYILLICILLSSCNLKDVNQPADTSTLTTEESPANTPQQSPIATLLTSTVAIEPTPATEPFTSIIIGSTGDIMCHKMQLMDAQNTAEEDDEYTRNGDEEYSFDHWFTYIKDSLEYADLMIGNLETTIASDNSLVTGYPFFATPKEILPALKDAGFDVLLNGNNHILDKEQKGLLSTIEALEDTGIYHTGAWSSLESKNTPLVVDVKGIKIGIISATCSLNEQDRLLTEEEKSYMYLLTTDLEGISQQITNCKNAGAEVIVMCPHWGFENRTQPSADVIILAEEYIKMGADIIFAHHPHVLQPVDNIEVELSDGSTREGIVFWSLGNFISNQMSDYEMLTSTIAYVTITKDNTSGEINIGSSSYLPIWTYVAYDSEKCSKSYCILPAGQILDDPEIIADLDPPSLKTPLNNAWLLATNRLGSDVAEPLRSVPQDSKHTIY